MSDPIKPGENGVKLDLSEIVARFECEDGLLFPIGISLNCINMEGTPVTCLVCTIL